MFLRNNRKVQLLYFLIYHLYRGFFFGWGGFITESLGDLQDLLQKCLDDFIINQPTPGPVILESAREI